MARVRMQKIGFIKRIQAYFTPKHKLQMKIAWLEFELLKCQESALDVDNRLEAYKDILAAVTRHHQLAGLLNQLDIDTLSKKTEPSESNRE